ncbi:DUF1990 domain-containing protein [Streptomyces sp. NPDC006733]|uniref:DUF1990 domain-containing protein n=1 Tax=Streptomyces sp. NPDC006733 TaxID=3155460 RepID=UPI0033EB3A9D
MSDLTYSPAGITADDAGPPPPGFHVLHVRTLLDPGSFDTAAQALFGWRMHRAVPMRVSATADEAAPGVRVLLRAGPFRAPCEVVWTVREEHRTGFAYGTLPGHPECGEEAFVLRRHPDGAVDFTVSAVSRPATWYLRAVGPLVRLAQRSAARRYGSALRKLSGPPAG